MSSFRKDNVARQTQIRLALLANGYTPTPNHDKRCFYPAWGELRPTPELIRSWEDQLSYQATGFLVRDGLCAIDIDIDDSDIVEQLWDAAVAKFPQLAEVLVRSGKGAKELWLCRTPEEFSVIASTAHVRPDEDPEREGVVAHRLECFGGGHTRQMGAFGAHTMKADKSGFAVEYTWADDDSPETVLLDALPLVSKEIVVAVAEMASALLAAAGWPRLRRYKSGELDTATQYDLTDDMRFDCIDGVNRTFAELTEFAKSKNPRCSGSWSGDASMVNRTRCLVGIDHTGAVSVLETASWVRHLHASEADRETPVSELADALSDKLRDAGYEFDDENYGDAPTSFRDIVETLHNEWAWDGSRDRTCLPIHRDEELAMSVTNLRMKYLQYSYEREGPRGGITKVNPVDVWLCSSQRLDVDGYRFMPDKPIGVYHTMGVRAINSYREPVHVRSSRASSIKRYLDIWDRFLKHLLPHDVEREWFCDWFAHKYQNRAVPSVGVLMVTPTFGVGRGTLFEFVDALFGERYVNNVGADNLMGTDGQAKYTDWLADALFITTDEILPDGDDGGAVAWRRRKAYERLKERIDPKPRRMQIVRKTLPNYQDMVYATFLMATNHDNAVPIADGDRRLVVLTNNLVPLAQMEALYLDINSLRNPTLVPEFVGALADWCADRDVSAFDAYAAPDFTGKALMQEANVSEFEGVVDDVLQDMPHEWASLDIVLKRVRNILTRRELIDSFPKWRSQATDILRARWVPLPRAYMDKSRTAKQHIFARTFAAAADFRELSTEERFVTYAGMSNLEARPTAKLEAMRKGLSVV